MAYHGSYDGSCPCSCSRERHSHKQHQTKPLELLYKPSFLFGSHKQYVKERSCNLVLSSKERCKSLQVKYDEGHRNHVPTYT
ncbi:unnamed protein product [Prunus brigantina]